MSTSSEIPDDADGSILHRMFGLGDDSTQSCMVDFWHVFPERQQALHFAAMIDDRELEVSISYYRERAMWQTVVKRFMVPAPQEVAALEHSLAVRAHAVGGQADGWEDAPIHFPNL